MYCTECLENMGVFHILVEITLYLESQVGESQCTDPRVLKKVADILKNFRGMTKSCLGNIILAFQLFVQRLFGFLNSFRKYSFGNLLLFGAPKIIGVSALF